MLRHQLISLDLEGLVVLGDREAEHAGIVSFYVDGLASEDIANYLDDDGILVRSGHHCAKPAHKELFGKDSSVRVSFGIYNTEKDIEKLITSLSAATQMLR
ncbi:hypothetical protein CO179_02180 [candidate division WWE3 bacterium CG_4_9_14_3_um_filter_39_7]|uniref:Aminotransferase class V domain-containing protein n=1 Tax=candidate division WWE3 bacterium CG_4_9_14_3_um_filter_39_7 TaxID=1975080 RepID=A0A2M7X2Q8_UNCKA|nr:MAG: hypothetical protein CO179_02180 [candidate division WWE3 bacterium CG_4_9_14_3_um_filter_39_7]